MRELVQLAGLGIGQPQVAVFLFRFAVYALDGADDGTAVGRNAGVGDQFKLVEVFSSNQVWRRQDQSPSMIGLGRL